MQVKKLAGLEPIATEKMTAKQRLMLLDQDGNVPDPTVRVWPEVAAKAKAKAKATLKRPARAARAVMRRPAKTS